MENNNKEYDVQEQSKKESNSKVTVSIPYPNDKIETINQRPIIHKETNQYDVELEKIKLEKTKYTYGLTKVKTGVELGLYAGIGGAIIYGIIKLVNSMSKQ